MRAAARRRRHLTIGGGVLAAVIVAGVVAALVAGGSGGGTSTPPLARHTHLPGAQTGPPPWGTAGDTLHQRLQPAARLGGNRACLAVARKRLKRSYHTLRELGEEALAPA